MNTVNIDRLAATLSDILSAKCGKRIKVTLQEGNENSSKDFNGDCPASVHVRRLGA